MLQNTNVLAFILCASMDLDQTTGYQNKVSAFLWVHGNDRSKSLLITKLTSIVWPSGNLKILITLSAYCDYSGVPSAEIRRMKNG